MPALRSQRLVMTSAVSQSAVYTRAEAPDPDRVVEARRWAVYHNLTLDLSGGRISLQDGWLKANWFSRSIPGAGPLRI